MEKKQILGFTMNKYGNNFRTKLFVFCLLVIPLANFIVFFVYANLGGVILSLFDMNMVSGKESYIGLGNYKKFFDMYKLFQYNKILLVSFGYMIIVLLISLPLSLICSYFLYKKIPFAKLIVVFLFLPNIIPLSLNAEFFRQLFDPINGVLCKFFNKISGHTIETAPSWLTNPKYSNWMLYFYTVWFGFGFNAILMWGAMTRIPQEVVESAELDGASLRIEFFKITIPIIWPTLSMLIVFGCMTPFTVYMQPLLIAFNGQANTTTIALYALQVLKGHNPYYSASISIMMAIISIPFVLIVKKLLSKVYSEVEI